MAEGEIPSKESDLDGDGLVAEPRPAYGPEIPQQKEFFKIPARFGHVPVAEEPLGYDKERRFEGHYPRIELPFQVVDIVKTGAERLGEVSELFPQGRNRLFFGDCLHVMRMLPSESIDLIYIDPPFFSGRNYNLLFGDRNEVRSFSDIWDGGMPGYLIWLNARLYEMKRLLKSTGSIYVHLDWHAVHYVKVEMDKIFGHENFGNEIVWRRSLPHGNQRLRYGQSHDTILLYFNGPEPTWNESFAPHREEYIEQFYKHIDPNTGRRYRLISCQNPNPDRPNLTYEWKGITKVWKWTKKKIAEMDRAGLLVYSKNGIPQYKGFLDDMKGTPVQDIWADISPLMGSSWERIGYPTQKPEALVERIINASSEKGAVVADFFCGGGTTCAVAQKLGRRWIGCDISRVAVALTADRIARILAPNLNELQKQKTTKIKKGEGLFEEIIENPTLTSVEEAKKKAVEASLLPTTGYSVEHWGIYEVNRLTKLSANEFRRFVCRCYGAREWTGSDPNIHGVKANELLFIGGPKETEIIRPDQVKAFAQSVISSRKPEERVGIMIGWGMDPKARQYAEQLMAHGEQVQIHYIKLRLWPLAGEELKNHVTRKHPKYKDFFAFILPPDVPRIGITRLGPIKYRFDVSEARSMNTGGKIINVQWDFDFRDGIFSATQGYQLCRNEKRGKGQSGFEGETAVEYTFEDIHPGTEVTIACRVQDDLGGEGMKTMKMEVL